MTVSAPARATSPTLSLSLDGNLLVLSGASSPDLAVDVPELAALTAAERRVLSARSVPTTTGLGAVITPLLRHLAQIGPSRDDLPERRRMAQVLRGLLSALAAERVEGGVDGVPATNSDRVAVLAMQIVYERLDDPRLTSSEIASVLGVSVRTVQTAFRASGTSVRDVIATLRSER
ncbi:hypothetical protein [Herbiconiux liangxiaofengii]|uniref:hypothetical protein n=1 Tax=Herbiconiux liangxiaofengii TaxID=3342795 RepID=UPI0035B89315